MTAGGNPQPNSSLPSAGLELSEEARAEIKEAIRIVREDRFERHAREVLGKHKATEPEIESESEPETPTESDPQPKPEVAVRRTGKTPPAKDPEPVPEKQAALWGNYAE